MRLCAISCAWPKNGGSWPCRATATAGRRRYTARSTTRTATCGAISPATAWAGARACWRSRSLTPLGETARALDYDTLLLLFSLFILLEGVSKAGVIDAAARLFHSAAGDEPLRLYLLLVAASVGLSAFIDNIPYVAAMLPVVQGVAALMNGGAGIEPELFYFGLLTGATLGGNLTPIGASANIAAIGILRKNGERVRTSDFLRIGVPFTLAAVLVGAGSLWLFWGV